MNISFSRVLYPDAKIWSEYPEQPISDRTAADKAAQFIDRLIYDPASGSVYTRLTDEMLGLGFTPMGEIFGIQVHRQLMPQDFPSSAIPGEWFRLGHGKKTFYLPISKLICFIVFGDWPMCVAHRPGHDDFKRGNFYPVRNELEYRRVSDDNRLLDHVWGVGAVRTAPVDGSSTLMTAVRRLDRNCVYSPLEGCFYQIKPQGREAEGVLHGRFILREKRKINPPRRGIAHATIQAGNYPVPAGKFAWFAVTGKWPARLFYRNGDPLDLRFNNIIGVTEDQIINNNCDMGFVKREWARRPEAEPPVCEAYWFDESYIVI